MGKAEEIPEELIEAPPEDWGSDVFDCLFKGSDKFGPLGEG
jgi:hypothetical protein